MPKTKTVFICQACGYQSLKWTGKCPGCGEWNTIAEEPESDSTLPHGFSMLEGIPSQEPKLISDIEYEKDSRLTTGIKEFDRILGGGVVRGSVVLVGGSPGIGKSTLLLQALNSLATAGTKVLYVSGEESLVQTRMRAERVGTKSSSFYIVNETNLEQIIKYIEALAPKIIVVDSIQVLFRSDITSSPGSVSQVKECGATLTFLAKKTGMTVFLIGHVTKDGVLAGPRLLEHMVDTVLYFEEGSHTSFRILRAVKNRFGATDEIGVFEMTSKGLIEVDNPSRIFLEERPKHISGSVVAPVMEGSRPILVEIQALVTPTGFNIPRRQSQGIDYNRISLLAAVLEKRVGLGLKNFDVFVNIVGGLKVAEPAVDLAIGIAITSNLKEIPTRLGDVYIGEVGLGGEVRGVTQIKARLAEAAKLAFKRAIIPRSNLKELGKKEPIEIIGVSTVKEAVEIMS